jgi:hypothetical protein
MLAHPVLHTAELAGWLQQGIAFIIAVGVVRAAVSVARQVVTARRARADRLGELLRVASPSDAFEVAHSILAATTCDVPRLVGVPDSVDHDGLWRAVAERPLTALVYTASQQPEPLAWLEHTVGDLAVGDQDAWRVASETAEAAHSKLGEWVRNAAAMERRQRSSVAIVMREAVTRYVGVRR